MKHIIYALVDPQTRQVRYVGRTSQTLKQRLGHHLTAARRNVQKPVYAWIRSIAPETPIAVILQEVEYSRYARAKGVYETTTEAAETKWMKRFERSGILNSINRHTKAYQRLINQV